MNLETEVKGRKGSREGGRREEGRGELAGVRGGRPDVDGRRTCFRTQTEIFRVVDVDVRVGSMNVHAGSLQEERRGQRLKVSSLCPSASPLLLPSSSPVLPP